MRVCEIEGCGRRHYSRGWCEIHYQRWRAHGDPLVMIRPTWGQPAEARFWLYVDKNGPVPEHRPELGPCWIWTGGKATGGYGQFHMNGRNWRAHRAARVLVGRPLADDEFGCHECDNPPCANPDHVSGGDQGKNIGDARARGRMATGDRNTSRTHPERLPRGDAHWSKRTPEKYRRGEAHPMAKLNAEQVGQIRAVIGAATVSETARRFDVSRATIRRVRDGKGW